MHGERARAQHVKSNKDIDQATALIEYLAENDEDVLRRSWQDLMSRAAPTNPPSFKALRPCEGDNMMMSPVVQNLHVF